MRIERCTGFKIDPLEAMTLIYEAFSRLRELRTSFPQRNNVELAIVPYMK